MLEKLKEYLDHQYKWAEKELERHEDNPSDIYWSAVHRAVGATELATNCGVPYEEAGKLYEETLKEIFGLIFER